MSKYTRAVNRNLQGLTHESTGLCSSCPTCTEECLDEGSFSWSSCDCCGSSLGGNRYAAHAVDSEGNIVHLDICTDCLMYLANGDEPEDWEGA